MAPLSQWRKGLFTREDKFNVHKLCGFPVLAHYAIRIAAVPRDTKNLRFDGSLLTPACLAVHLMLSCTSLVFHIPTKRIKEGSRIWPEFRLHSIVFACRSIATMMITWAEQRFEAEPIYAANVVVVFCTLLAADAASRNAAGGSSGTIRDQDAHPLWKYSVSFMQFLGTCGCLIGIRAFAAQFMILFIIQTYAFTLTLRRKNLVTHNQTLFFYVCQLTLGTTISFLEVHRAGGLDALFMFCALSTFAFFLRAGLGLSKYLMWGIMAIICQGARADGDPPPLPRVARKLVARLGLARRHRRLRHPPHRRLGAEGAEEGGGATARAGGGGRDESGMRQGARAPNHHVYS